MCGKGTSTASASCTGAITMTVLTKLAPMPWLSIGCCFFFQAEDGIRDPLVTGVQTCALPICAVRHADDVLDSEVARELALERRDLRTEDEAAAVEHRCDALVDLRPQALQRRRGIDRKSVV